ncbi:MAG: NAD(P)/FAD-dependent oxidoreductase [Polyangiales bacterium]
MTDYDVVVIGGGPAGSLTSSLIRRQDPGRRVLILERESFPRHHIGESSIPSWRPILERAGVLSKLEKSGLMRKVGTLFRWGAADDESWTIDFRDPETGGASVGSYQVDRAQFDHLLLDHARSLGVEVREQTAVRAVERLEGGGHRVHFGEQSVTARYLVDASGQARVLTRLMKLEPVPFDDMNNFAVYGYWRGSAIARFAGPPVHEHERWTYIATCPDGWVWHIPTHPDLVSVGVVTDAACLPPGGLDAIEEFYLRNVRECGQVAELLANAELVTHPMLDRRLVTIRDWSYHVSRVCGPDYFLVGDAAAFVDPILSSGMLLAANGASLAANALHTLWNDPSVDVPLLLESYQTSYDDMASSYHRLARIWYSRNFKYATWHWEAKRQRLRAGRDPGEETNAQAFMHLCLGSFVNPVEGAARDRGLRVDFARPDSRIYAAHLFKGEASPVDETLTKEQVRARIVTEAATRWRELLGKKLAATGFETKERESYFSDSTMGDWRRVRYLELRPERSTDPFDRVVFPITEELPQGVLPLLDGRSTLRDALIAACKGLVVGQAKYAELLEVAQQQVLQLDLRGFLRVEGDALHEDAAQWPEPLVDAVSTVAPGAELHIDPLGTSLSVLVRAPGRLEGAVLVPQDMASKDHTWREIASTAISYRGNSKTTGEVLRAVLGSLALWDRDHPGAMRAWWREHAPRLAGEKLKPAT